jgi:uncharacterized Zn finger protein
MADSSTLRRLLTLKQIQRLAGVRSFQRGQSYLDEERVRSLVVHGDTLTATVCGTEDYAVRLVAKDGILQHRCSCPVGADGGFCKHAVAVALGWLGANQPGDGSGKNRRIPATATPLVSLDDLRPWLLGQSPATLAGYLLETAERDDRLREKLLRAAARATAKGIDLSAYRKSLDRATRTGGFIDYYGAGGYAEGVREAVEPLRELLADTPEQAAAVIDLAEFTLERVEEAMEQADDSNGEIGTLLAELQELHLAACRVARPDPEALARRLFAWELSDHWDVFYNAAETYAELLGANGLATYRRLAEAEWAKLPALRAGDHKSYEGPRFRLTSIMEALARTGGDVDALAAIKAKDLTYPYNYLQIAELYRDAKRPDDALAWGERGLKAFPDTDDMRLLEFLADEYLGRKRPDDALALIWRPFTKRPSLADYQRLETYASRAHVWPHWRERALAELRRPIEAGVTGKTTRTEPWWGRTARDTLVQVFLWEKDVEAAWTTGHGHPLERSLALELAAAREKTHPTDAIPIYLREVELLINHKSNRSYEEAIRRLKQLKTLHLRLGLAEDWSALLSRLRTQHKAKRNFIALAAGL